MVHVVVKTWGLLFLQRKKTFSGKDPVWYEVEEERGAPEGREELVESNNICDTQAAKKNSYQMNLSPNNKGKWCVGGRLPFDLVVLTKGSEDLRK
ncbi:hypothetical protein CEXT_325931 [Caerostris extrusa]|uniref:Uncharacterized protein n=1 Tax=Caerostris extrusa TaxID=172846 RepID=A0AAV4SAZ0_CAEEX|nr:hypothetical protein CEXT_325931 [Caerostris extrusa]